MEGDLDRFADRVFVDALGFERAGFRKQVEGAGKRQVDPFAGRGVRALPRVGAHQNSSGVPELARQVRAVAGAARPAGPRGIGRSLSYMF